MGPLILKVWRCASCRLPSTIKSKGRPAFETLQPHLLALLPTGDVEFQVDTSCNSISEANACTDRLHVMLQEAVADAIAQIAKQKSLSQKDNADCLLPLVISYIKKDRPDEV